MLERYIEKCVIRQVYLCEQLYEKESVLIDRLAEQLDVCPATIINDIDKILLLLKERIATATHEKHTYQVVLLPDLPYQSLLKPFIKDPIFTSSLSIFDWREVGKNIGRGVYFIKQGLYHSDRLMEIFEEMGYLNEEQEEVEIPEKDFRYLLLAVMNYLGKRPEKISLLLSRLVKN